MSRQKSIYKRQVTLYHVTLNENVESILEFGIDPNKSPRNFKASWYVRYHRLQWAIEHTLPKHGITPDDISIFKVIVKGENLKSVKRFSMNGLFYATQKFEATLIKDNR